MRRRYGIFRYHPQRKKFRQSFPFKVKGKTVKECRESANKWFSIESIKRNLTCGVQVLFPEDSLRSNVFKNKKGLETWYEIRKIAEKL